MVETLRKKTRKSSMIQGIIALILMIVLLVFTKFAIVDVLTGAKELDITADPASFEGKYVKLDVDYFLTDFVEHTTTTTRRYGGSTTTVNGNSYIAYKVGQGADGETPALYFFSVYMSQGDERLMEQKMKAAWEQIGSGAARSASSDPMEVTGTWMKMDAQIERYFRETMGDMGISESSLDQFYFYTLDTGRIGGQRTFVFWAMMVVALI